jgi:uncharacterized lipoprotein
MGISAPLGMTVAASLAMALAGCDSATENEVEQTAEAVDESYEAEADLQEAMAQGIPDEQVVEETEAEADRLRAEGEEIKDDLEDMADELDAAPQ